MKSCFQNLNVGDIIYVSMYNDAFRDTRSHWPETHIAIWHIVGYGNWNGRYVLANKDNDRKAYKYSVTPAWNNCIVKIKKCQQYPQPE